MIRILSSIGLLLVSLSLGQVYTGKIIDKSSKNTVYQAKLSVIGGDHYTYSNYYGDFKMDPASTSGITFDKTTPKWIDVRGDRIYVLDESRKIEGIKILNVRGKVLQNHRKPLAPLDYISIKDLKDGLYIVKLDLPKTQQIFALMHLSSGSFLVNSKKPTKSRLKRSRAGALNVLVERIDYKPLEITLGPETSNITIEIEKNGTSIPNWYVPQSLPPRPTYEEAKRPAEKYNEYRTSKNVTNQINYLKEEWGGVPGTGIYKEYSTARVSHYGSVNMFSTPPTFENNFIIGSLSKEYTWHTLRFYNFMRTVVGQGKVFVSDYKQIRTYSSAWSAIKGLGGGHNPTWSEASSLGIPQKLYDLINDSRGASNLMGASKPPVSADEYMQIENYDHNLAITSIWNEGEGNNIKGLGHRAMFMCPQCKDVGIGVVPNYLTWMGWGAKTDSTAGIQDYYQTQSDRDLFIWPSEVFPWRLFHTTRHQCWDVTLNNQSSYSKLSGGTSVKITMEHYSGPDLESLQLNDTWSISQNVGGSSKYHPYVYESDGSTIKSGGHYFDPRSGNRVVFRPPYEWFKAMHDDMQDSQNKNYHKFRFVITPWSNTDASNPGGNNTLDFSTVVFHLDKH